MLTDTDVNLKITVWSRSIYVSCFVLKILMKETQVSQLPNVEGVTSAHQCTKTCNP